MNLTLASDKEFIQQLTGIVLNNLEDENFGVEELIRLSGLGKNTFIQRLINGNWRISLTFRKKSP